MRLLIFYISYIILYTIYILSVSEYGIVCVALTLCCIQAWSTLGPWLFGCIETLKTILSPLTANA